MKGFIFNLVIIPFFFWTSIASAQGLSVSAVTPAAGTTGVDTSLTISLTFNKSLKNFDIGTQISEVFLFAPEPLNASQVMTSGNTLSVLVSLAANKSYEIGLSGKLLQGTDGSTLGKAVTVLGTITTAASLPTASISGKMTPLYSLSTNQTAVAIFALGHNLDKIERFAEVNSDSSFTISNVEAGTYNLIGLQFKSLNPDDGKTFPFTDSISVAAGAAITNINFVVSNFIMVSSTPSDGSVNVDTSTTISLTFSEPLRSSEENEKIDGLEVKFSPEPLFARDPILSQDKMTVSAHVSLAINTVYTLTIISAMSQTGNSLQDPVTFSFSTGASIPTGSISGTITNAAMLADGAVYAALIDSSGRLLNRSKINRDGTYRIANIDNGSYYVVSGTTNSGQGNSGDGNSGNMSSQNSSASGASNSMSNDQPYLAYYGWDGTGDNTPTMVTVSNGAAVTGINMTLGTKVNMKLLSSTPQNGDVNVASQNATISFTFNLPLNTLSDNQSMENLQKNFFPEIMPINLAPSDTQDTAPSIVFTNFGRTVTLSGTLTANTYYTVLLPQARDVMGMNLTADDFTFVNPTIFGFSTGSTLPASSVSGTVSLSNKDANYVVVGLLLDNPGIMSQGGQGQQGGGNGNGNSGEQGGGNGNKGMGKTLKGYRLNDVVPGMGNMDSTGMGNNNGNGKGPNGNQGDEQRFQGFGMVNLQTGAYTILAPNGKYWPVALTQVRAGDQMVQKQGFFDPDSDSLPDSVLVQNQSLTGINISFKIPRIINLTGILRDMQLKPVRNAMIFIYTNQWRDSTTSGNGGTYQFQHIPAGEYTVEIYPPSESNLQYKKIDLEIGEKPIVLNITLRPAQNHYGVTPTTAGSYPIIVTNVDFEGKGLDSGDEMAVKLITGEVVGAVSFMGSFPDTITAYADDPATSNKKEGYAIGDTIIFEIYKQQLERGIPAFATFSAGDGKYGTGTQAQVALRIRRPKQGEQVENRVVRSDIPVRTVFDDNSSVEVHFQSGNVAGAKMDMKNFGMSLPDTFKVVQRIQNAAAYYQLEAAAPDTFTASLSFSYDESMLTASGIDENHLIIAYYDTAKAKWKALPTTVDVVNKIATVSTKHFSLWVLANQTDSLLTGVDDAQRVVAIPKEFALEQNYPNPFNPTTTIRYQLKNSTRVTLTIYNLLGQQVRTLVNTAVPAGAHEVIWDSKSDAGVPVASGIYFYRIKAGNFVQSKKMILLR